MRETFSTGWQYNNVLRFENFSFLEPLVIWFVKDLKWYVKKMKY